MNETGKVGAVDKDALWVEARRETSCSSCAAQKGCGQSLLSRLYPERQNYLRLSLSALGTPRQTYEPGDTVEFTVPEGSVLMGSLLIYLIPVLALLAGAMLGREMFSHELGALFCAALSMAATYACLSRRLHRQSTQALFEPELVGLIARATDKAVIAAHDRVPATLVP